MRPRHVAAWFFLLVPATLMSFGCPPRELRIEITPGGARAVTKSCTNFKTGCADGTQEGETCCNTDVMLTTVLDSLDNLAFQVFLVDQRDNQATLRARSACLHLQMNCFDFETEPASSQCFADAMNRAMNDGLGELAFDGMDMEHLDIGLSLHTGLGGEEGCVAHEMFACALLIKPSGQETYDIVCADCTGNAPSVNLGESSFNIENTLCGTECFVVDCKRLLDGETL